MSNIRPTVVFSGFSEILRGLVTVLRNDQWDRIERFFPGKATDCGVTAKNHRLFVEAILWIIRTGSSWLDLSTDFGYWHRVYVRYNRWSKKGIWGRIFTTMSDDSDFEYLMVDGSIVRVYQHGAAKKTNRRLKRKVGLKVD